MKALIVWLLFLNSSSFGRRTGTTRAKRSFMGSLLMFVTSSYVAGTSCMPENPALFAKAR
jgi:hypothetical protein